jgi:hypothetical protein
MENRTANNKSVYGMLMTALFYVTGSICTLRVAAWLAARTLLPIISRILWSLYHLSIIHYSLAGRIYGAAALLANTGNNLAITGLFSKKLVRAAAAASNHDLFVPIQSGTSSPSSSSHVGVGDRSILLLLGVIRTFVKSVVLISIFVGACGVGVYYFTSVSSPPPRIRLPVTCSPLFLLTHKPIPCTAVIITGEIRRSDPEPRQQQQQRQPPSRTLLLHISSHNFTGTQNHTRNEEQHQDDDDDDDAFIIRTTSQTPNVKDKAQPFRAYIHAFFTLSIHSAAAAAAAAGTLRPNRSCVHTAC